MLATYRKLCLLLTKKVLKKNCMQSGTYLDVFSGIMVFGPNVCGNITT